MTGATLITSVSQAMQTMKALEDQSVFHDELYHQESRLALRIILHGRMEARLGAHLEACKTQGIPDRRNGGYSRRLLVGLGDLELKVPRSRRYNPAHVLSAYARRAPRIDRLILAAFVLGLSTRKVRKTDREAVKAGPRRIMNAAGIKEARGAARRFASVWRANYPKAVACLAGGLDALLAHYRLREEKWRKAARTTNATERCFVEVRGRTRPMGVMAGRASLERILYAVFAGINQNQGTAPLFPLTQNN